MGIFKSIFGSSDKKKLEEIEEEVNKINSGETSKIYPILKPGSWVGLKYGAIKKVLLGTTDNPELVIAYGYNGADNFVFIKEEDLYKKSISEILKEAHQNLDEFKVDFNEVIPSKVVVVDGYDFCSEKILSKPFRLKLQEILKSNKLLVSLPRRRNLMATSAQDDKEIMNKFLTIHHNTINDDSFGSAPIISSLFTIEDGEISGVIDLENYT